MVVIERELSGFTLPQAPTPGSRIRSFTLVSGPEAVYPGFQYTLSFPLPNALKVLLTGPDRPLPPHDNVDAVISAQQYEFVVVQVDARACSAVLAFPPIAEGDTDLDGARRRREVRVQWSDCIILEIWEQTGSSGAEADGTRGSAGRSTGWERISSDLPSRSYALTERGMMRHWRLERDSIHLGLGEKAAPLNLTGRSFSISGTDAACYDAFGGDPLYKHTPFLVITPRSVDYQPRRSTYALYHPSNANATWDIGRLHDDPWGYFKTFTQDWGGIEEWYLLGKGVQQVTRTWAELVGRPRLVGRDWLGYLASGMGLGESDDPPAQELLAAWPDLCRKHEIPCSAIHFSSGYTVGEDGNRYVFTMNTKRYPDFKGLVAGLHREGIKVVPNIKPYMLKTHPSYDNLHAADGLFYDPHTKAPVVTRIWSSGVGVNGKGSWVDMTSPEGRAWWNEGVRGLIELGVDGLWNDNNEYYLHDDEFLARNEFSAARTAPTGVGRATVGLLGRMVNTEMMAKVSHDALISLHPHRRPYVLTRSGNISTFKYATGTWSGDNETSWRNLRGSVAIQLNSGISLLQSTGADVGGFGGPVPCPELFVRWVQLGVTHSRFCIHAYKPTVADPSGAAATNTPWMHPAVLPVIRNAIKWRYRYLPYLNALNWRSHLYAEPPNAWLGWGEFESDPKVYAPAQLEGYDAWFGAGQLLTIPALHEGETSRTVYLPRSGPHDTAVYYDLHPPHGGHSAGSTITLATPLEHIGLLAREGAALLSGRDVVTITAREGAPRTTPDGVSTRLVDEGGVVALDDYRAVEIFPGASGRQYAYTRTWVEDDGIAAEPARAVVEITYSSVTDADADDQVVVRARFLEHEFKPLWGTRLHILLPVGDTRTVLGAVPMARDGRTAFVVNVEVP